mmetsp:Transcript_35610/g.111407  ORF Transcript_35610/g.111407 Transcript_35610/m.111407 type:complete len:225 (-) Transcript_35610:125-799(-)
MSTKVLLVVLVIFVACSYSSEDVSYDPVKLDSRGKSFQTPELKLSPTGHKKGPLPKTPHAKVKTQGKAKMSGLKKPRAYSKRDSLSPEAQLRPQHKDQVAEVLVGKDTPAELGQQVRLSRTTLKERPYLPDKGAGRITAVQKGGMSCMVKFDGDAEEYLFNVGLHNEYELAIVQAAVDGPRARDKGDEEQGSEANLPQPSQFTPAGRKPSKLEEEEEEAHRIRC